jgi:hypothetical protein
VHVFKLPFISVTVIVNVVVPIGKETGALFVIVATPQLSAVIGTFKTTFVAAHDPASATVLSTAGQTIVGFTVSNFVTTNWHVWLLPLASVAVAITVNVPAAFTVAPAIGFCVITIEPVGVHPSLAATKLV